MPAAHARPLVEFHGVGESQHPEVAIVAQGRKTKSGAHLQDPQFLGMLRRREMHRTRSIHDQKYGNFSFLKMALEIEFLHSRRDVPVDAPEIFANLVFAMRLKFVAEAFQRTAALPEAQAADP